MLSQVLLDALGGELEKVPLHSLPLVSAAQLPDEMDVVLHDDEAVHDDAVVFDQEAQAIHDNVFILIRLQQRLPLQASGGEELRVGGNEFLFIHAFKIHTLPVGSRPLVGWTQELRLTPTAAILP